MNGSLTEGWLWLRTRCGGLRQAGRRLEQYVEDFLEQIDLLLFPPAPARKGWVSSVHPRPRTSTYRPNGSSPCPNLNTHWSSKAPPASSVPCHHPWQNPGHCPWLNPGHRLWLNPYRHSWLISTRNPRLQQCHRPWWNPGRRSRLISGCNLLLLKDHRP